MPKDRVQYNQPITRSEEKKEKKPASKLNKSRNTTQSTLNDKKKAGLTIAATNSHLEKIEEIQVVTGPVSTKAWQEKKNQFSKTATANANNPSSMANTLSPASSVVQNSRKGFTRYSSPKGHEIQPIKQTPPSVNKKTPENRAIQTRNRLKTNSHYANMNKKPDLHKLLADPGRQGRQERPTSSQKRRRNQSKGIPHS